MRITIVLAILTLSFALLSPCNITFAQEEDLFSSVEDPGAIEIGESLIHPASPLYFLKTIREKIETVLTTTPEAKAQRELEFAQRRLREVHSLIKNKRQDLIDATLERYKNHLKEAGGLALANEDLEVRVGEAVARHLNVLQKVYDQVGNPRAKQAIRAALERAEEHNRLLLQKLTLIKQQQLIKQIASRQAFACKFLAREATASGLTDTEKEVLRQKVKDCREAVRRDLRDELEEIRQKRLELKEQRSTPSSQTF